MPLIGQNGRVLENESVSGWNLTGNSGTNPFSNFIGTTDDVNLVLRRNSVSVLEFRPNNVIVAGSGTHSTPFSGHSNFFGNNAGWSATSATNSNFFGNGAGVGATNANNSNFFGASAGSGAENAPNSNFLGANAGSGATSAEFSNFLGANAGYQATNVIRSNFLGANAGYQATEAIYSNFLGYSSGYQATNASNSNFFGGLAGWNATNADSSNFFGNNAGYEATDAEFSNFIGSNAGYQAANASYSNFIGFGAGGSFTGNSVGSNNIIIGTKISLPNGTVNSINIGGVLFGTGTHSDTAGSPSILPSTSGKIGIGVVNPDSTLHIVGDFKYQHPTAGAEKVLTSDANGGATWQTPTHIEALSTKIADYAVVASDFVVTGNTTLIEMNMAGANNVTLNDATLSSVPVGAKIDIVQYGAGQTTIAVSGAAVLRSAGGANKIAAQYGFATVVKRSATEFYLTGDIVA